MSIYRNRRLAAKYIGSQTRVGSAAVARVETALTGDCGYCFPHGWETRSYHRRNKRRKSKHHHTNHRALPVGVVAAQAYASAMEECWWEAYSMEENFRRERACYERVYLSWYQFETFLPLPTDPVGPGLFFEGEPITFEAEGPTIGELEDAYEEEYASTIQMEPAVLIRGVSIDIE